MMLGITLFCLNFFLILGCIPALDAGYWAHAHTPIFFFVLINGLLGLALLKKNKQPLSFMSKGMLIFLLLSIAMFPFHTAHMRDLLGCPQLGEGIIMLFACYFMSRFLDQLSLEKIKKWIVPCACLGALALGVVCFLFKAQYISFYVRPYNAFLAFVACGLLPLIGCYPKKSCRLLIGILVIALLWISKCKTAWSVLPLIAGVFLAHYLIKNRLNNGFKRLQNAVVAGIGLIPIMFTIATWNSSMETLVQRKRFLEIILSYFQNHPLRLLIGMGFGSFGDATVMELLNTKTITFTNWIGMHYSYAFHSMNGLCETLLSLGIMGFLAYLLGPLMLIKRTSISQFPYVCGAIILFFATASTWFIDIFCHPFLLLGFYIAGRMVEPKKTLTRALDYTKFGSFWTRNVVKSLVVSGIGLIYSACTFSLLKTILSFRSPPIVKYIPPSFYRQNKEFHDPVGLVLASYISNKINTIPADLLPRTFRIRAREMSFLRKFPFSLIIRDDDPLFLKLQILNKLGQTIYKGDNMSSKIKEFHKDLLVSFLQDAPCREDIAMPYILSLQEEEGLKFIETYFNHEKNSPFYDYVMARMYQKIGKSDLSLTYDNRAKRKGIHRFLNKRIKNYNKKC